MDDMSLTPEQTERVLALVADLAREGRTDELGEFLEHGVPVDVQDSGGNSLLMLAAYHGHATTVELLIAAGADPDLRNDRDQAPITGAMFKGERAVALDPRQANAIEALARIQPDALAVEHRVLDDGAHELAVLLVVGLEPAPVGELHAGVVDRPDAVPPGREDRRRRRECALRPGT